MKTMPFINGKREDLQRSSFYGTRHNPNAKMKLNFSLEAPPDETIEKRLENDFVRRVRVAENNRR